MRDRYENLLRAVDATAGNKTPDEVYRILEVGTYDGERARMLIRRAQQRGRAKIQYIGFDLFEECTPEISVAEKSKTRLPPSVSAVWAKLHETGAELELWKGFTSKSFPLFFGKTSASRCVDLAFIDGGHSLPTIDNDWNYVSRLLDNNSICILDDYYPDRCDFGCQNLAKSLGESPDWSVKLLEPVDHYTYTKVLVQCVEVRRSHGKA